MRAKVVHIITRLDLGGAQKNTLYTVAHLDPNRFEAVLACGPGGPLDAEALGLGVRTRFFPDLLREIRPLHDAIALFQLWAFLEAERPAIVHTHSSKAGILGRLAARLAGVPVVIHTFHGFAFHDRMPSWKRALFEAAERAVGRVSGKLVFVSEANRAQARRLAIGDPSRYALIRSGVALGEYPARLESREKKKAALGVRMHRPLVASIGNLKPQKNPHDFLEIARRVLERRPETSFYFVGDGPLRPRLEAECLRLGLQGRVFFPGWRRDAAEILAAADVFVLTSLWEGLPRSLVEAMKSGLPCVAYAADGVRDVLRNEENGFLIGPGDWPSAADKVALLLGDPALRARLGAAAAASIGPEFDIDAMVRSQEALYGELLQSPAAGPSGGDA